MMILSIKADDSGEGEPREGTAGMDVAEMIGPEFGIETADVIFCEGGREPAHRFRRPVRRRIMACARAHGQIETGGKRSAAQRQRRGGSLA
ncbi:hypothetical protein [Sphingobium sp.]|uniref:hypothetical protein n=1 Tax=Sphingobium sp. TaxID=1912891 RepID=UPI0035C7760E